MPKITQKHLWDTQFKNQKSTKYYLSILYNIMGLTVVEVRGVLFALG
jgi:hypothetical protein